MIYKSFPLEPITAHHPKKVTVEMKKNKFSLKTFTEIKIFLLFLLDNIRYPIDYTTLSAIIAENIEEITFDYAECLKELVDSGHLLFDEVDSERYYMISDTGRLVAAELYDTLDPDFRDSCVRCAAKHISLSNSGASISAKITETEDRRFKVSLRASDARCEFFSLELVVQTRAQAELIRGKFEQKPDGFYRGIMFCATGKFEYIS